MRQVIQVGKYWLLVWQDSETSSRDVKIYETYPDEDFSPRYYIQIKQYHSQSKQVMFSLPDGMLYSYEAIESLEEGLKFAKAIAQCMIEQPITSAELLANNLPNLLPES